MGLLVIIVGRLSGTVGLIYFLVLFGHKPSVTFKQLLFISYGGIIRGAIAFALCLNLDDYLPNREVIVTTALTLVCLTTIFFGSLMPLVSRILVPPKLEERHEYD